MAKDGQRERVKTMFIDMPGIAEQKRILFRDATEKSCKILLDNLNAPSIKQPLDLKGSLENPLCYLLESDGWEPPSTELVCAWFEQFKQAFPDYQSDGKIGELLGLGKNADRRIRSFKSGERDMPYGVCRKFLIITGRVNQEIIPVMGFLED